MRTDRLASLASEVWTFAFELLDLEPGWTADDAGRVAAVVQRAFEAAVWAVDRSGEPLYCEFCGYGPECIVCGRGRP